MDPSSGTTIDAPRNMTKVSDTEMKCVAPKTDSVGSAKLQISANGKEFQDVDKEIKFYNGPRVTSVSPTYGVTKNPKNLPIEISGENFECPNNDCSKTKVRFTNKKGDRIYMDAVMTQQKTVMCPIPKYPAPETLDVDVSFNGQDYTNDKVKFGFLDPYVTDIQPRLLSTKGTTRLTMYGYGFQKLDDESKSLVVFKNGDNNLQCDEDKNICTKVYSVENENKAEVDAFGQDVMTKPDGKNIGFDSFNVDMRNPDGDFTKNNVPIRFYKDPVATKISS